MSARINDKSEIRGSWLRRMWTDFHRGVQNYSETAPNSQNIWINWILRSWPSTVSEVPVLSTSSKSSAQSRICHVGQSVRLAVVTCSFWGQTRPSASEVSALRLLSSGTQFHTTSAHSTTVDGSSDWSRKLIFSDKPINTAWLLWEQFCWGVKLCNCNCNYFVISSLLLCGRW